MEAKIAMDRMGNDGSLNQDFRTAGAGESLRDDMGKWINGFVVNLGDYN